MQTNLYVDNIITGCDTEDAASAYYKEAQAIMASERFNLHSWSSNSNKLTANAVQDKTADDHSTVNVLGLHWDPTTDLQSLVSKPFFLTNNHLATKRQVLQATSPLGIYFSNCCSSQDLHTNIVATSVADLGFFKGGFC